MYFFDGENWTSYFAQFEDKSVFDWNRMTLIHFLEFQSSKNLELK